MALLFSFFSPKLRYNLNMGEVGGGRIAVSQHLGLNWR